MLATTNDLFRFWMTPWSAPLRAACVWVERFGPPISGKRPDTAAPTWVRPLFLQRWVAQAITARLAWLEAHAELATDRYGNESEPCWEPVAWLSYDRRCLRDLCEETLRWMVGMEVERLLRIAQEPPSLVGGMEWTQAALGASEHIAQVYAELKRRHKAMRARAIVREDLRAFITWQPASAATE